MKNSHAENLSESFLNVDQKIITEALEIDDAKKLKQYIKQKPEEAKKPFYIKPVFKKATAIAACIAIVAVTAFALANKTNNITPNNDTSSGNNLSSNDNSENSQNDISSNTSSVNSQDSNVIYVTADSNDNSQNVGSSLLLSLKGKYLSTELQEKMDYYKDYKEKEVVYRVIVDVFYAEEYYSQGNKLADANEEVQSLYEQKIAAGEAEQKARAEYSAFCEANPGNEPEIIAQRNRMISSINAKEKIRKDLNSKWEDLRKEIIRKYDEDARSERLEFATQLSKKSPTATSYNKWAFYMELTAEDINILADKGGYSFKLAPSPSNSQQGSSGGILVQPT